MQQEVTFDFSFEVPGKIWKVSADSRLGNLAFEVRDEVTQEVFFLLFFWESKTLSDYIQIPETNWWSTLVDVEGGIFFLNKYADQNDPGSRTLLVFDPVSDTLATFPGGFLQQVSEQSYHVQMDTGLEEVLPFPTRPASPFVCKYPEVFFSGSEEIKTLQAFIGKEIAWGAEYFEEGDMAVFAYTVSHSSGFARYLMVIQCEEIRFHIQIEDHVTGFAEGSFFIIDQSIVFVTNSNQFNVIQL